MKLRISRALHARARQCASEVEATLSEFVARCYSHAQRGNLAGVAFPPALTLATRSDTVVITIPNTLGNPPEIRTALARGVIFAESRRPPPFETDLIPGRDYTISQDKTKW
jgi:hypothetical protein